MREYEKIVEAASKVEDFQKKYNTSQKNFAYILGKNLTLFICMLVPLLLVGFVWTDFGNIIISTKMISDGVLTVMLFAVGEIMMTRLGTEGGKLDTEYIEAKGEFDSLVKRVGELGTMLMGIFCDWQIDAEMEQAIHFRLRMLKVTPKMWEDIKNLSHLELVAKFGKKKARQLEAINRLKPIELNEAILLYNGEYAARGGVPQSGDAYLKSTKHVVSVLLACVFTGLLTVSVVVTFTSDISFARVIYTIFKLGMLLFRMAKGYDRGAKAYNTIEVRQYKAKCYYLRLYLKFVTDKIYLKLGDRYGDIGLFIPDEEKVNNEKDIP